MEYNSHEPHPTEARTASRLWKPGVTFYVSHLPEKGGDWGYTTSPRGVRGLSGEENLDHALALSPYWQRRFSAYCRRVGAVAKFHKPSN